MVRRWGWFMGRTSLFSFAFLVVISAVAAEDDNARTKRSSLPLTEGEANLLLSAQETGSPKDKKAPRGFLGMRGKKAPSGFLGMRGRRFPWNGEQVDGGSSSPSTSVSPLGEFGDSFPGIPSDVFDEQDKRGYGSYYTLRGKKLPRGFMGLRGKKVPSGFMGMRGKKAPSYFMGLRGKKEEELPTYDDLEDLLHAMRYRYRNSYLNKPENDKRAPRGFLGMRGKKSEDDVIDYDSLHDVTHGNSAIGFSPLYDRPAAMPAANFDKRAPRGFLGMRG